MDLDILQGQMNQLWRKRERHTIFAGDFGRVEEEQFVDNACSERGAVEGAAGFDEDAEDFALLNKLFDPTGQAAHSPTIVIHEEFVITASGPQKLNEWKTEFP